MHAKSEVGVANQTAELTTMVKEFYVVLSNPPENGYVPDSDVTGHVVLATDEDKSGYKTIEVSLMGYAAVSWSEQQGFGDDRHTVFYSSREEYVSKTAVLWNKQNSPDGQLAAGTYRFQFSLKFQPFSRVVYGLVLPPTYHGLVGRIVYEVQAVIVKESALKINKKVSVEFPYSTVVDPNISPGILSPQMRQVQKTLCCLCCASGPISLTARIPRSGFCVGFRDAIPFEVDIENGSNRQIRYLQAELIKRVICTAQGHRKISENTVQIMNSNAPIQSGSEMSWRPPPLTIPNTEASITTCGIIELRYILKIQATVSGAINPYVEFTLLLGNVPVSHGVEGQPPSLQSTPYPALVPS